jgi:hypothetical protein
VNILLVLSVEPIRIFAKRVFVLTEPVCIEDVTICPEEIRFALRLLTEKLLACSEPVLRLTVFNTFVVVFDA